MQWTKARFVAVAAAVVLFALPVQAEIKIQEVTSPGGIKAWLVENHDIPFTALNIRFKGGTSLDAPGKRGATNLMTALIEEGSGNLDSQGFAAARDALAADFSFDSDEDGVGVSARFLTENRDKALALLQDALTKPTFDPVAIERVRGQVLQNIAANLKDPSAIGGDILRAEAFGSHPYGTSGDGTLDSVKALTRDDILAAYHGAIARDRIYVAAAGDISAKDLGLALDKLLGGLPATGAPQPADVAVAVKGGIIQKDFPGPQSQISFYQAGVKFEDPDYFAATILNEILGGNGFSSRLMNEVREKRGLTYGVDTGLADYDHASILEGSLATANDKAAEAIKVIQTVWADVAANGVTQKELDDTKTYLTGAYPLRFDGNRRIASILVGMQILGLPSTYPETRNAKVEAVTLADVNRVAKSLLTPDKLRFIVVGKADGVTTSN
ncbi:insulinase family protein [bacterium]|nr:insulinase family protein [bacterium]